MRNDERIKNTFDGLNPLVLQVVTTGGSNMYSYWKRA